MYLFQILFPVNADTGEIILAATTKKLNKKFGGVTAYIRAPAEGLWKKDNKTTERDQLVIVEVMSSANENAWWKKYKKHLELTLSQDEVVIRRLKFTSI